MTPDPEIAEVSLILASDPAFVAAWGEWCEWYPTRARRRFLPLQRRKQLKRLAAMGPERAAAAIDYSIAQGYQGIWEPTADTPDKSRPLVTQESPWHIKQRLAAIDEELEPLRDELRLDMVRDREEKIARARILTATRRALADKLKSTQP